MKILLHVMLAALVLTGCARNREDVWDDTKTCGRHVSRGIKTLGGKSGDSRQVRCREDFMCTNDLGFIPLPDEQFDHEIAMAEGFVRPAKDPGRDVPGIEAFQSASESAQYRNIFKNVHFVVNSNLISGKDNNQIVRNVAAYMKKNPKTYIYVEGHCDERGPEAYNLALGARRSNAVRTELIKEGVDPDKIFTVSYGKERPLALGYSEDAWAKNRRAEFKIFQ